MYPPDRVYFQLKNRPKLTKKQEAELDALMPKKVGHRTARAYQLDSPYQSGSIISQFHCDSHIPGPP